MALEMFTISPSSGLFSQGTATTNSYSLTLSQASIDFQDLQTQYLTSISSWCPNKDKAFTFDASLSTSFYVNYGTTTVSLDSLQYCGSPLPTSLTYSFDDPLFPTGIGYVPNQLELQFAPTLKGGTYNGTVVATAGSQEARLNVSIVINMPPYFTQSLQTVYFEKGLPNPMAYTLPSIVDDEGHDYTFGFVLDSVTTTIVPHACVTLAEASADTTVIVFDFVARKFTIDTSNPSLPGTWRCDFKYKITLTDSLGAASPTYELTISLILGNVAPYWVYDPPKDEVVHLGQTLVIDLPECQDPNSDPFTLVEISSPPFSSLSGPFQYTVSPLLKEHLGPIQITGNISDGQSSPLFLPFTVNVTVLNFAPQFTSILINQTQIFNEFSEYALPTFTDYESPTTDPVRISVCLVEGGACNDSMPGFITFVEVERLFQFKGLDENKGEYTIQVTLTDAADNSSVSIFQLLVTEYVGNSEIQALAASLQNTGPPEFATPLQASYLIFDGKSETLPLPEISDPEDDLFECLVNLGSAAPFVTFKKHSLIISPLSQNVADTPYSVNIILRVKNVHMQKSNKYRIDIIVQAKQANASEVSNQTSDYYIEEGEEIGEANSINKVGAGQRERVVVRLRLTEVTNLGKAKIKVYARSSQKLMTLFSNITFTIKMTAGELEEHVPYTVESADSFQSLTSATLRESQFRRNSINQQLQLEGKFRLQQLHTLRRYQSVQHWKISFLRKYLSPWQPRQYSFRNQVTMRATHSSLLI
ncbi:hypothetical protein FGO68_gene17412 [Halteria grandinella]|uniref:Cadherin domain-containing protein n=1 Tax=Halteria grandinella TaxID=5974 RepID=A0A8J8P4M2_HALGN|nr:hypothetical protein FGO68_gene17412 [Halteria grandinella]